MAKAQANGAVYKRMAAKLGSPSNGTGAIDPKGNVPGGGYKRKAAGSADNGKATYARKNAPDTTSKSPANGTLKTVGSSMSNKSSKGSKFAD